ncbi:haloacid dehalogenase type II [Arthrobacter sp. A5]|uniref:haloacid dehalogenase type II n=1 Tax=Arthrobacter sp. A5 TaxID=576926 RepID=UPI003DA97D26
MNDPVAVIVFDVNETLSDMSPMGDRFAQTGAPALLAKVWFAALLRDGFALAAAGGGEKFAVIGAESLRVTLTGLPLNCTIDEAVDHIMEGFAALTLHPDAAGGVRALKAAGFRLTTLTNGSTRVAEKLLSDAGILGDFEKLLSVEDGPGWKPLRGAYDYAAQSCGLETARMLLTAVHPWDIHGAAHAGMRTAWINRTGTPYPAYFTPPDFTISTLDELAPLLTAGP